jgi:hypothetical protein
MANVVCVAIWNVIMISVVIIIVAIYSVVRHNVVMLIAVMLSDEAPK